MTESPQKSATEYKTGTKKKGQNDDYYYVLKDRNNKKRWVKTGCLFVIYKINPDSKINTWNYGKFPSDWKWVGGGGTVPIGTSKTVKYPNEEQFMGNPKYTAKMRKTLTLFYKKLKSKDIIQHYKIVSSKGLQNYMSKTNQSICTIM